METATTRGHERPVVDAEAALRYLADASSLLAGSLDYETTLKRVAELLVPDIADWCGIDIVHEDRQISSGLDPELDGLLLELRRRYRQRADQSMGTAAALSEGRSVLMREPMEPMVEMSAEERALYERLSPQSYMIVPLIARGHTLGAMSLISCNPERRYGPMDLAFAEHLGRRFALALDNARLYDQAERSLALLDTLFATAPVGLGFWDRELRYVRVNAALADLNGLSAEEHIGKSLEDVLPEMAPAIRAIFERILATGEPVTDLELEGATPRDPGHTRFFNASYYPVRDSAGDTIGVGAVVSDITDRRTAEHALAASVQRERSAREAAEAAEKRARFLSEASVMLDASLDYETTLQNVARLVVAEMADWCGVQVADPTGALHNVAVAHIDPAKVEWARAMQERYPSDSDSPTGAPNVVRTGKAELYPDIPEEMLVAGAKDEEHLELIRQLEIHSAMIVPMTARGRTLGAISFIGAESGRRYDQADLEFAEELARRAGMAVDNARLYTELSGIADTLQAELLPTEIPDIPGVEVAVRYRAAGELNRVGGDFYDVFARGQNKWAVVIGDVSGKGAPAAAVTALARYTLRTAAAGASGPSQALAALNEALLERRREQEFCSVALAFITLGERGLETTIALGGHPPALVKRANGEIEARGTPGMLMGFTHDPPLSDEELTLEPGDTLLLYTDGVTDAASGSDRFGDGRLESLLQEMPQPLAASDIAETIERTAVGHARGQPQDDMALVAVQVPSGFVRAGQVNLGGGPEAIARARAAVAELLQDTVGSDRLYDLQLLVSEVVTNAVRHGGARKGEQVDLRIAVLGDQVRLEVRDPGPGFHEIVPKRPETDRGGGYGLYLVDLFSSAWGVSGGEGTCVWLEVPLEADSAEQA